MAEVHISELALVNGDHDVLNADRCSNDEQLLITPFLLKPKNTNVEGS
jgi:hypothetical protein